MLLAFGITVLITKRMGIGSVVGTVTLIPVSLVMWNGWAGVLFAVGLSAIVLIRHRSNIANFFARSERTQKEGPAPQS